MFTTRQLLGARDSQEDFLISSKIEISGSSNEIDSTLYLVADGMGGHRGGSTASRIAATSFRDSVARQALSGSVELLSALHDANSEIAREVTSEISLRGMGTTIAAVFVTGNQLNWISVGDSPFLLYRNNRIRRLNADHSMLPILTEEAKSRGLSADYAFNHNRKHQLRSAVTGRKIDLIDQGNLETLASDIFILATDGIDTLSTTDIEEILHGCSSVELEGIGEEIESKILTADNRSQDNATFIVFSS